MILYVLAVWGLVTAAALLLEVGLLMHGQGVVRALVQSPLGREVPADVWGAPLEQVSALPTLGWVGLYLGLGVLAGWACERYLAPVQGLYHRLQRRYPEWYQRWPAPQREVRLALLFAASASALALGLGVLIPPLALAAWSLVGFGFGLCLLPVLRLRTFKLEDRPETPPQALIHQIAPRFSIRRSLLLGQLYLRLLLPCFCLFLLLILPLHLGVIQLSSWATLILMSALLGGLGLAWYQWRDSQFAIELFQHNLIHLGGLMLVATALLGFGVASHNLACLGLMAFLSGYVAGSY